jgi:hypothetical protein
MNDMLKDSITGSSIIEDIGEIINSIVDSYEKEVSYKEVKKELFKLLKDML